MPQEVSHACNGSSVGWHEGVPCWEDHKIGHVLRTQPCLLNSQRAIMLTCGDTRRPHVAMRAIEGRMHSITVPARRTCACNRRGLGLGWQAELIAGGDLAGRPARTPAGTLG